MRKRENPGDKRGTIRYVYDVYIDGLYRVCAVMGCESSVSSIVKHLCDNFSKGYLAKDLREALKNGRVTTELTWFGFAV